MRLTPFLLAAAACGASFAQVQPAAAAQSRPPAGSAGAGPGGAFPFRVAPHGATGDDGVPRVWAAHDRYKASFDEGFTFYPVLGAAWPANLPLAWRTRSIQSGSQELVEGARPAVHHAGWRVELRYAGVTEVYDLRADGVEQSFVFARRPETRGDLVIAGAITTELACAPVTERHGALTFHAGDGTPIVRYGEAFAIDAAGKRTDVATSFDGATIRLHVPDAWLAAAIYPIVVDPLTNAITLATSPGSADAHQPEIGRETSSGARNVCYAYGRIVSASDYDLYVGIANDDYTSNTFIYTNTTTSSLRHPQVAFVGAPRKWVVVWQREDPTGSHLQYLQAPAGSSAAVTAFYTLTKAAGTSEKLPDVGGTSWPSTGTKALVVYQTDQSVSQTSTANTEVRYRLIDFGGTTPVVTLAGVTVDPTPVGATLDREYPAVTQVSGGGQSSWIVAYQQYSNLLVGDAWDVRIGRIDHDGTRGGMATLGNAASTEHELTPRVEGQGGRYMATFAVRPNTSPGSKYAGVDGRSIQVHRFDWPETASAPTRLANRTITGGSVAAVFHTGSIAHDTVTGSHWCVTYEWHSGFGGSQYQVVAERVGYTGGTVEQATVFSHATYGAFQPSCAFNDDFQYFELVFWTREPGAPIKVRSLTYPAARNVLYGTPCGPAAIGAPALPHAGLQSYAVTLSGAPPNQPAALWLGGTSSAQSLAPFGAAGCFLLVGNPIVALPGTSTGAVGSVALAFPLPDAPLVLGDVRWQWLYLWPASPNPLKLGATRGLRSEIR
jgi:hypothetical protein